MRRVPVLALLATVFCAPHADAAEDLGRLFFTPQQRQDLNRRRAANAQEAAAIIQESTLTLQGQVSRSGSGKTTTWINGVPQQDAHRTSDPTRVPIRTSDDEPEVTLKVGETRDLVRGETRDALGGGKIEVSGGKRRDKKP